MTKRIPLSGNPNLVDITPDGRWIYVAIALTYDDYSEFPQIKANPSGGVDVIDTASLEKVKTIAIRGGIHDLNVTPGRQVRDCRIQQRRQTAGESDERDRCEDQRGHLEACTESSALSDGDLDKSRRLDQVDLRSKRHTEWICGLDFATQAKINEIKLPDIPAEKQNRHGGPSVSHGIALTADQKTLLVNSRLNSTLYAYSVPDLKLLGGVALGGKGAGWLVITPDDKTAYVANEHTNNVSVVDIKSLKEIALIPVGFAPARNATWMVP